MKRSLGKEKLGATLLLGCAIVFLINIAYSQGQVQKIGSMIPESDEAAIRKIVQDENVAWNRGDATAYSRHFAADGTFTNIRGQFFTGHAAFLKQHEVIFQGLFKDTTLRQDVISLKFIEPGVAVVETLTSVSGLSQTSPGAVMDSKGRLRTRLLQVVAKRSGGWEIVAYHNVDVKPGVQVPEPQ